MHSIPEVNFEEVSGRGGNLGLITLNRPQVLNALNHAMFIAIDRQLSDWEEANHIKAVIIRAAEGRAFCAGGDIRAAYERKLKKDSTLSEFFRDEYKMNRRIFHYPKPYIALLDGITMGGGVGVSIHGSHRVATNKLIFSMPETGIGFYPDVGTTYVLPRLRDKMGFYLGLTGARISYSDCFALGIVNHVMESKDFPDLIYQLADTDLGEDAKSVVTEILQPFSVPVPESVLLTHQKEINHCFSEKSVEKILAALEAHLSEWCHEVAAILKTKSPTSLKVTLRALQEAAKTEFDTCIETEFRLTTRFLQGSEFFEGIRAVVIDKDQTPHWHPATLKEVKTQDIAPYFAPLEKELI